VGIDRAALSDKEEIALSLLASGVVGVMTVGADYGARMVYDYNAGEMPAPSPSNFTR